MSTSSVSPNPRKMESGCKITVLDSKECSEPEHLSDLLFRDNLNNMRLGREMCDVIIVVDELELVAHKLVLASCSPYFRGMFREGNFDESQSSRIVIDPKGDLGIKYDAMELLIQYIYTGHIEISHNNVIDLIRAADLLELTAVKNQTLRVIEEHITFETYLDIREVGSVFNCPKLQDAVDRFIRKNFSTFTNSSNFYELTFDGLMSYLKHDHLRTDTEEIVLDAVLRWCRKNDPEMKNFEQVADSGVRFELIAAKYLLSVLQRREEIVSDYLLNKMQSMSLLPVTSRPRFSTQVLAAFPYGMNSFYLIHFYGNHIEFTVKHYPANIMPQHSEGLLHFEVAKIGDNQLYLAGGIGHGDLATDAGFVYDLIQNSWSPGPRLLEGVTSEFGMTSLDKEVMVVGGDRPATENDEVAILDFESSEPQWTPYSKMTYTRSSVTLTVLDEKVYALGGLLDGGYTSTVEVYDPESNAWEEVDSMTQSRCRPGVTIGNGMIYVVGGLGDSLIGPAGPVALKTAEFYDPENDQWTSLPDMYFARQSPAVAFVNKKLYVFGGGSPSPLLRPGPERTIECFDFEKNEWFVLQQKIPGRANAVYVSQFFDNLDT